MEEIQEIIMALNGLNERYTALEDVEYFSSSLSMVNPFLLIQYMNMFKLSPFMIPGHQMTTNGGKSGWIRVMGTFFGHKR